MDTRNQVKQYIDIAWRRKWWVVAPLVLGGTVSLYLYSTLPKIYRATTTILVTRQAVPEDIVRSTVTMRIDERMKQLKVQVLSDTYLERVAREVGLIGDKADPASIELATRQINDSVILDWDKRDLSWFRIMVDDRDPERAARIANRLAEMFIDQNTESRVRLANELVEQFDVWLKSKDAELRERDRAIAKFKAENMYELPDQEASSLQILAASQNRVAQLSSDIQLRSDRLSILRAEERAARNAAAASGLRAPSGDPDALALAQLERELSDLLVSYTEENPLVRRKRDQIEQFRKLHPALVAGNAPGGGEQESSPEIRRLQAEIRNLESDRAREQARVNELTRRLEKMPKHAQTLAELTRDYEMLRKEYDRMLGQKEEAKRSFELEEAKKGSQFQIQDLARTPAVPFEPQLFQLLLMGLAAGAGVGVGITALLEFLDQSVRGEEQFSDLFPELPILGTIPTLTGDAQVKPKLSLPKKRRAAAGAVAVLAILGGLLS